MKILLLVRQFKIGSTKLYGFGMVLFVLLSVLAYFFFSSAQKQKNIENALLSGQRLEVSLDSGTVQGQVLTSEQPIQDNSAEVKEQPSDVPNPNAEVPAAPAEVATTDTPSAVVSPEATVTNEAPAATETTVTEVTPVSEQPAPEQNSVSNSPPVAGIPVKENVPEVSSDPQLAWLQTDFIGPRLSDEMIRALTGVAEAKKGVDVKKVSIKDLSEKPVIVIIIRGLGLSSSTTEEALDLPSSITMGFSPYSPSLEQWVKKAKDKGYEFILNVPMETKDYRMNDPGPYALVTSASKDDNITRLKMLTSLIGGYKAVYSGTDEIFTNSIGSIEPILQNLKDQGLYFVYGGGYSNFSLVQVADKLGYPILVTDVLLDSEISPEAINAKLQQIEDISTKRGYVVVMANPYPITIRMLQMWLPKVESKGFNVAPISILLGKNITDESANTGN